LTRCWPRPQAESDRPKTILDSLNSFVLEIRATILTVFLTIMICYLQVKLKSGAPPLKCLIVSSKDYMGAAKRYMESLSTEAKRSCYAYCDGIPSSFIISYSQTKIRNLDVIFQTAIFAVTAYNLQDLLEKVRTKRPARRSAELQSDLGFRLSACRITSSSIRRSTWTRTGSLRTSRCTSIGSGS
jgi:hypothetical protein